MERLELRKGNLVTYNGQVVKVLNFDHGTTVICELNGGKIFIDIDKLSSIPLTKDVMMSLGAVNEESPVIHVNGITYIGWMEFFNSPTGVFVYLRQNGISYIGSNLIESVHHLQNLYYYLNNFTELVIPKLHIKI